MRAVPFRVVFVAGMGERAFPSGTRRSELDLRGAARQAGDVTPRQRDLYMFLETLLSARDRLVLSYVARDELTGSPLSPSSIVRELREILATGYLGPQQTDALFAQPARPPLRRYDDTQRAALSTLATREAQAKALGQSLRAALPEGVAVPDLGALRRGLPPATFAALGARLSAHAAPDRARRGPAGSHRLVVPLEALRRFLEDPLQGSARFRLRMREVEGEEELLDREDEPFETDRLQRATLLRQTMWEALFASHAAGAALPSQTAIAAALQKWARVAELRGVGPTGLFGAAELPEQFAILSGWRAELQLLAGAGPLEPTLLRFGRPSAGPGQPAQELPGLRLDLPAPPGLGTDVLSVEIVGRSELRVGTAAPGSLVLAARRDNAPARIFRDRLRAFVDHVVLAASGRAEQAHATHVVWAYGDRHSTTSGRFAPLSTVAAQDYLGRLIGDLVAGATTAAGWASGLHPYLLPCEAVFAARNNGSAIVDEVEKLRDHYLEKSWLSFSTVNGPVPQAVERHDPPGADEAERLAHERFGLFFESARRRWRDMSALVRYRKPPQLAQLGLRHAVVEASAGTGKTYILEHLVVDLLLSRGATIDQILVVTFTEKATAELSTRIRRKLEELQHLDGRSPQRRRRARRRLLADRRIRAPAHRRCVAGLRSRRDLDHPRVLPASADRTRVLAPASVPRGIGGRGRGLRHRVCRGLAPRAGGRRQTWASCWRCGWAPATR